MATRRVLVDLLAAAAAAGFPSTDLHVLGGLDAARRVSSGEHFDLVFLAADSLHRLAVAGHVNPGTVTPLFLSHVAVAIGATEDATGQPRATLIEDAASVRRAMLAADSIGYSTGPSGTGLVRMIHEWGLFGTLSTRLVQAPSGIPVAQLLAEKRVQLGFQQLSELIGEPGVRVLGVLPPECAIDTVFSGGVGSAATDAPLAARLLSFLSSGFTAAIKSTHGFDAPHGRSETRIGRAPGKAMPVDVRVVRAAPYHGTAPPTERSEGANGG
jgi:molybdate transport system substrate-binding protein